MKNYQPTTTCKCCGQPLTIDVLFSAPPSPRSVLSDRERRMLDFMRQGVKSNVMIEALFPTPSGLHGFSLAITRLNKKLRPIGWEVWAGQKGSGPGTYRLREYRR